MLKPRGTKKPSSRRRYEEEHPTVSFRLDKETHDKLKAHLRGTGCSFADFVKDALGREETMVEKRVEMLASRQATPSVEDRLRRLEDLVHQIFSLTVDTEKYRPLCPSCENQERCRCQGTELESKLARPWAITWKCPKCGFFIDTYNRIDPESIEWLDFDSCEPVDRPKASARHRLKKYK